MIATLLNYCSDPFIEFVVEHRERRLANFERSLAGHFETVVHQSVDRVSSDPQKLSLSVVDEVKPVGNECLRSEINGRR